MNDLKKVIEILKQERDYYKKILIENKIEFKSFEYKESIKLSTSEKINIYMDLFIGRSDVFAERWESKDKSGYSPVCVNKFIYGVCNIQKFKCKNCPNQVFKKLTKEVIIQHIKGEITIGIYPMLDDDTCYFLAVDFDDEDFKESVNLFIDECALYNLDCLVEISRSGNGAYVWFFFEDKYPAIKIRKIISSILTTAMIKYGKISFSSYDRMFPAQDKLLKSGIGNLIALPLNGKSGKNNTTVFVDKNFIPYNNQFEVLKNTKKISIKYLDELYEKINDSSENGMFADDTNNYQLSLKDFSDVITIILENEIKFIKKELSSKALKYFMRMSSFLNRKYYENQAKRLSVYGIPRVISLYKIDDDYLYLPRGCLNQIIEVLNNTKVKYIIDDKRIVGEKINVCFKGELREEQELGLNQLLKNENGIFVASTGFGKTIVAVALIDKLKVNTLILVNNKNLCEQWNNKINQFLKLDYESNTKNKVGTIHSTSKIITNKIDIALIQSLASNEELRKSLNNYGLIIFDEVHHLAAVSYENVVRSFSAKYIFGFTATPKRSDGYEKINYMVIGPCIFNYNNNDNAMYKKILYPHFTKIKLHDNTLKLTEIETKLINNSERNSQIINDIKNAINENKKILVLTNRVEHSVYLFNELKPFVKNVFLINGSISKCEKNKFNVNLNCIEDERFIIISTGKYIGEGFDEAKLDTLFLTMPFRWRGTLQQYVGRLHRNNDDKFQVEVHDYIDINIPVLFRMYSERKKGYKKLKYMSIDENNKTEILFDEHNYFSQLTSDLELAESIKFYVQYANYKKIDLLLEKCKVNPLIYSRIHIENINDLILKDISINMIIINDSILWYGEINPFIFKNDNLSIARLEDKVICNNIITSIEEDN